MPGLMIEIFKILVFTVIGLILLKAAKADIITKTVANIYPSSIMIIALFNHWLFNTPDKLLGLMIAIPFLVVFYTGKIGGADVKLITAISFFLGLKYGLIFIIAALFFASCNEIRKKINSKSKAKTSYPFVPYLFCGYLIALAMMIIRV